MDYFQKKNLSLSQKCHHGNRSTCQEEIGFKWYDIANSLVDYQWWKCTAVFENLIN